MSTPIIPEDIEKAVENLKEHMTPEQLENAEDTSKQAGDYMSTHQEQVDSLVERVKESLDRGEKVDTDAMVDELDFDDDAKEATKQMFRNMGGTFFQSMIKGKKPSGPLRKYLHITHAGKAKLVNSGEMPLKFVQSKIPRGFEVFRWESKSGHQLDVYSSTTSAKKNKMARKLLDIEFMGDVIIINPDGGDMDIKLLK